MTSASASLYAPEMALTESFTKTEGSPFKISMETPAEVPSESLFALREKLIQERRIKRSLYIRAQEFRKFQTLEIIIIFCFMSTINSQKWKSLSKKIFLKKLFYK